MITRADVILDAQADLAERFLHPSDAIQGYVQGFAHDTDSKGRDLIGYFYPYYRPGVKDGTWEADFCKKLGSDLAVARAYQVTEEMSDLASSLLTEKPAIDHIEYRELPSDAGFLWLDIPMRVKDANVKTVAHRVITWGQQRVYYEPEEGAPPVETAGLRLTYWSKWDDHDDYSEALFEAHDMQPGAVNELINRLGPVSFSHTVVVPYGVRFAPIEKTGDSLLALVHILWMLMDMEFVTEPRMESPSRGTKKRIWRSLKHGEVNVITLRRVKHQPGEDYEPKQIAWTCRWIVQGHWRHYRDGKNVWIHPYIKGPDGLAIKDTKQLWRLAR